MKTSQLFDSSLQLSTPKTTVSESLARQIYQSNLTFAPYYKAHEKITINDARGRQSSREFPTLSLKNIGELLNLSLFDVARPGSRPYPAAGGIYCVHLYLAALGIGDLNSGIHYVRVSDKTLEKIGEEAEAKDINQSLWQPSSSTMPLVALLVADLRLLQYKYRDLAYRMAMIEAGALMQTMYLAAAKLELPICALGGISDRAALKVTKLAPCDEVVFACGIAIGGPQNAKISKTKAFEGN